MDLRNDGPTYHLAARAARSALEEGYTIVVYTATHAIEARSIAAGMVGTASIKVEDHAGSTWFIPAEQIIAFRQTPDGFSVEDEVESYP